MIKREGKARGKYYDYFNVRDDGKEDKGIYLDKVDWRFEEKEDQVEDQVGEKEDLNNVEEGESDLEDAEEEANVAVIPVKEHNKPECVETKKKELEAFDKFGAYVETQDRGQERLSSRWVLTDKSTNEEKRAKARLVCRGFEENVDVQRLTHLQQGNLTYTTSTGVNKRMEDQECRCKECISSR